MLKTRAVEQYLDQAVTSGILGVFLFTSDGLPVAETGKLAGNGSVYGALMINIWDSFEQPGVHSFIHGVQDDLQSVVLQNTEGTIMVIKIHDMLLAIIAEKDMTQGMLRAKITALKTHLVEPLKLL
uniref:Roadblock/LAMTOR2 domain-containing protein n=1 Tax=Panagrolaimus sp. JU765 TaxID=591449 RepID=A0AC34R2Z2_9BILA